VYCWGDGTLGQLGDGTSAPDHIRTKAARVKRGSGHLTNVVGIAAEEYHTCARRTNGTVWCWGNAFYVYGQLGDGTRGAAATGLRTTPVQVVRSGSVLTGITSVGTGASHTCARRVDGSAWCWGLGSKGQLGDGTTGDPTDHLRLRPVRVVRSAGAFTGVRSIDGGDFHTCALRTDRSVWCWGANDAGQLGRGSFDDDPHPYPRKVTFP
jgi:alpha-tubulin suppressor-like RCC1 family protein